MRRCPVLLVAACLLAGACGSRRSTADFEAAEQTRSSTASSVVTSPGDDAGAGRGSGDGAAGDPLAGGTTSAPADTGVLGHDPSSTGRGELGRRAATPGSPVRIGFVGTLSGPAGGNVTPIRDGVQVWVKHINDRGGVNGHPVDLVVADDRGDSARHRSLVQQLVEGGVLAFVGNADVLLGPVSVEYLARQGVPRIGGDTGGDWMYSDPLMFPQASSGLSLVQAGFASVAERAVAAGQRRVAVISCQEAQVCRDGARMYPALASRYGVEIVYQATTSIAQPDFTAECLNAQGQRADVVIVLLDANSINRVAASCARQGFHPTYAWNASLTVDSQKDNPELQGALIGMNVAPWTSSSTPALKAFRDAMATYAPSTPPSAGHITGWTAGVLFGRGAAQLQEPPTSAAIIDGLHQVKDDDLGGLTYPLTFTEGQPAPRVVCWYGVRIAEGSFVADNGGQRKCDDYRG
jgi:branched-chain amino acid transport system substrate-binding protein